MNSWIQVLGVAALLSSALVGGTFFAFSSFIMKALGKIPAADGIRVMQSINIVVINPLFLGVFCGTALLSGFLAVLPFVTDLQEPLPLWFLSGGLIYVIGTFLLTIAGNVPLNNQLATASPSQATGQAIWRTYLKRWTRLNHARTAAAILAAFCFLMGLLTKLKSI